MHAIILSAGQGRRLLPLTHDRPKCLLELAGRPLLAWQLDALLAAGVGPVTVVTGYATDAVEKLLAQAYGDVPVRPLYNPFYEVADNLASCWLARERFAADTLLLNGDTVFEPAVLTRLLAAPAAPITLAVDRKDAYDEDDMKVILAGERLVRVGKALPVDRVNGESIGMLRMSAQGAHRFREAVDLALREPAGLRRWYLSVIDALAHADLVRACAITGLRWAEVDFPRDVAAAAAVVGAR
jgi:L-glutamine-phosphate cytidylyltransferase